MKKLTILLLMAVVSFTGFNCKGSTQQAASKKITIAYPNWAEGVALTHLAKVALDEKGYETEIMMLEPGPIYATLAKGGVDLFLDGWLPNTHKSYWEEYGADIDKLGEGFSDASTGLAVPAYVEENSISDLIAAKDKYQGKIVGIGSGAGIHMATEKAIKEYALPFEQITSSGPAMVASLEKAVNEKKPIVITAWKPHFMWARFELKYLEDAKNIYPKDAATTLSRKGFAEEQPEVAKFFKNFNLSEKDLYSLMGAIKESDDELTATKKWYEEHKDSIVRMWE